MQRYCSVYWTHIKKKCEWGPVYIEKRFPGVTLPARVNLSKCLYDKQLTPLPKPRAENSARAWSDSLALTELTRLCKPSVFLEKKWLGKEGDLTIEKGVYPSPLFVSSVIKRQVSVRKCRKCWLTQRCSGGRVTLQPGATFLHIRGDLAALERPQGIGWENNEQTKFGTWSENKRGTTHRGLFWTAARLLGQRGLIAYLGDDFFFPAKEFTSFFLSYLNLVIPLRFK